MTYGFPIDSRGYASAGKDTGVVGYRLQDGEQQLDVRKVVHELANTSGAFGIGAEVVFDKQNVVRDWYFSDLQFARSEHKTLGVSYRQTTFATTSGTSKTFRWYRSKPPILAHHTLRYLHPRRRIFPAPHPPLSLALTRYSGRSSSPPSSSNSAK